MNRDKYYGFVARHYDAERCHSLRWALEQTAVNDMVRDGPVIDVPVGTGRFGEIYRAKGLAVAGIDISGDMLAETRRRYPNIECKEGTVFDLPFPDKSFATAVCTRLLDWLYPDEMVKAVAELRRVAETIIVTLRHGEPGVRVNQTHNLSQFYGAIDGLFIDERRITEVTQDGTEEIFRLRPPNFFDVVAQIDYDDKKFMDAMDEINRLTYDLIELLEVRRRTVTAQDAKVSAQYWTAEALGEVLDKMAARNPAYDTSEPPRFSGGPVSLLRVRGKVAIIDGRRRITRWRNQEGTRHPVLVMDLK